MKNDGVEQVIASEAFRFIKKDRSKTKLVLGLYALSLKDKEAGKVTRASYFFFRHLDDILDGESNSVSNPLEYALSLRDQVENDKFDGSTKISRLAQFTLPLLESKANLNDNPREEFINLIDTLIFDFHRRQERSTLNAQELETYYKQVLNPGFDLMLTGMDADLRSHNIPDYASSLGRLYSVRDLEKDWQLGIINIPGEMLQDAELTGTDPYTKVVGSPLIEEWRAEEISVATTEMRDTQQLLAAMPERFPARILSGLGNSAIHAVTA